MWNRYLWLCAASISVLGLSGVARADTPSAPPRAEAAGPGQAENSVGEVVVTARRRAESIIATPVAVTVNSGTTLLQRGINQAPELVQVNAGLTAFIAGYGARDVSNYSIRGQGGTSLGLGGGVAVYFAEVPNFGTPFYDLDGVQVLKGPQGTLFGTVTTGGAVLFTPRMPTDQFEGYVDGKIGQFNERDLEFAVSGPILGDVLTARFSGQINRNDGFSTNLYDGSHMDGTDYQSYRGILQFKPTDWLKSTLIGVIDYNRDPQIGTLLTGVVKVSYNANPIPSTVAALNGISCPGGVCPTWLSLEQQAIAAQAGRSPYSLDENSGSFPRTNSRHYGVIDTTTVQPTGEITLKNIVSFQATDALGPGYSDVDGTPLPALETFTAAAPGGRQLTEEFQVQGSFLQDRVHLTSGVFYDSLWTPDYAGLTQILDGGYVSATQALPTTLPEPATCAATAGRAGFGSVYDAATNTCSFYAGGITNLAKTRSHDVAVYGQADIKITDKLSLTGGYRETWSYRFESLSPTFYSTSAALTTGAIASMTASVPGVAPFLLPTPTPTLPVGDYTDYAVNYSQGTYTVALDYMFTKNIMVYGTTRTGYTPGGFNPGAPAGFTSFTPEHVTDYEIGGKIFHDFGPVQLLGALDFYYDTYDNIQRNVTESVAGRPYSFLANVGKARIEGVDLDTTLQYNHWFEVGFRFSYTNPKILQYDSAYLNTYAAYNLDLYQDQLATISKVQWSVNPSIKFRELIGGDTPDLVLSGNVYYQSRYAQIEPNVGIFAGNVVPGYMLADLRLDWFNIAGARFSAAAVVKNIANFNGEIAGHDLFSSLGLNQISVSEPRDFYVELNYKF